MIHHNRLNDVDHKDTFNPNFDRDGMPPTEEGYTLIKLTEGTYADGQMWGGKQQKVFCNRVAICNKTGKRITLSHCANFRVHILK